MKILAMADCNWLSHTSRVLEVAKVLRKMGHKVVFAGAGYYTKLPQNEGFKVLPVKTLDPFHTLKCSRSGRANWYGYDSLKECVESDLKVFRDVNPDIVLADYRLSVSTSCELAEIPLAVILNAFWTNYYSVKLKAPEHFALTRIIGKRVGSMLVPLIKKMILSYDALPYRRLRRELGLSKRTNIWDIWRGDLNLIADIPEYGPTKNLPSNFHYIGPIFWSPDTLVPEWLEKLDQNRPTIYFTMDSTGNARFFDWAVDIFGNTDYQCIMTTGRMTKLTDIPKNFFVTEHAHGEKIIEKCDVVVCHGGNGTIYQAMSKGVPIIGIPTMHDQEFNLDRIEELGMGIHLSELKFRPEHLVNAVTKVLNQNRYRDKVRKYKEILAKYDGPQKSAELITKFLSQKSSNPQRPSGIISALFSFEM